MSPARTIVALGFRRLLLDPQVDFLAPESPRATDFECGDLLARRQAIDRALAYLEVGSHLVEREYLSSVVFHRSPPGNRTAAGDDGNLGKDTANLSMF